VACCCWGRLVGHRVHALQPGMAEGIDKSKNWMINFVLL
jgi:hypothetical protein